MRNLLFVRSVIPVMAPASIGACVSPALILALGGMAFSGCATMMRETPSRPAVDADLAARNGAHLRADGAQPLAQLPPDVSIEGGIDETKAVAIALWNNAAFQENLAKLGFARADLVQAGMLANPTLSLLFPLGPKQLEFTAAWPLETLWLRPKRVAIAELEAERLAKALSQSGLDLARDVRVTLSELALAADRERIAGDTTKIREQLFEIARTRHRLGEASEMETIAARAELERTREEATRAAREKAIVRERLSFLLGWPLADGIPVSEPAASTKSLPPVAELEGKALAARPDLRAAELAVESAGRKAGLADAEVLALSGILDANGSGKEGFEMGPGVALPLPLFQRNDANRLRAKAEIERAGWNYLGTRQRIISEVRESRLRLEQASAALVTYETQVLPPFDELARASRRGYELGELSPLAAHDAGRQLLVAQLRRAELRADVRRAWAELERSVGTRVETFVAHMPKQP